MEIEIDTASTSHVQDSTSIILPPFPQEIITEILLKLPVKPLSQFKCDSKSWLALISSVGFIILHLRSSVNDKEYSHHRVILSFQDNIKDCSLHSLLYRPIIGASDMDYPNRNTHSSSYIGSANGLICIATREKYNLSHILSRTLPSSEVNLYIWNPSIRLSKKLPNSGDILRPGCSYFSKYGFGYDELHDDYKVVVVFNVYNEFPSYETTIRIYSLKTDSWRTMEDFQAGGSLIDCLGKFVNGKLYWTSSTSVNGHNGNNIISLDLAYETWEKVEQPNYVEGNFSLMLGVLLGSDLFVLCNYERSHPDVWVMKNNAVEAYWIKMFTIQYPDDPVQYANYPRASMSFSSTLCESNKGEILLLFKSISMIYNPKDDSIRQPQVTGIKNYVDADIYVESLVSPL